AGWFASRLGAGAAHYYVGVAHRRPYVSLREVYECFPVFGSCAPPLHASPSRYASTARRIISLTDSPLAADTALRAFSIRTGIIMFMRFTVNSCRKPLLLALAFGPLSSGIRGREPRRVSTIYLF